jgi:uncharacterized protein YndB with AHSA1/START domain
MDHFEGHASRVVEATPDATFALISDIDRLPEWNAAIEKVVDQPATLAPGAEWTVRMHPPHIPTWGSISKADVVDRVARRFSYETRNTDGNPSYVTWSWTVEPRGAHESVVAVSWRCELRTFDRRYFAGPMRKRGLAREVPRSLDALASMLATPV